MIDEHISMTLKNRGSKRTLSIPTRDAIGVTKPNNDLLYSSITTELVEDNAIKSIINNKGEMQVGKIIYKISPYSTFYADIKNEAELKKVYEIIASQNDITIRVINPTSELNFNNINVTKTNPNGIHTLNNLVYFTDTFKETTNAIETSVTPNNGRPTRNELPRTPTTNPPNNGRPARNEPPRTPTVNPPNTPRPNVGDRGYESTTVGNATPFDGLETKEINFKSGALGIWDTYTKNQTIYRYFNSNYRASVLFYNRNYGFGKSLGIKVKLQKQGLLWWNKTEAQEIIAGWERMVYKQIDTQPSFTRPANSPPLNMNPNILYINPFAEKPAYGYFASNKISLYKWKFGRVNTELFSLMIPYYLVPGTTEDVTIPFSTFKPLVMIGWDKLKDRLVKSVPGVGPIIVPADPFNYKFPVFDIETGTQSFLSINDMEKMPKAFNTEPNKVYSVIAGQKIRTYISPYYTRELNTDIIDIPLEFSTANIKLSYNLNSPISISNTLNSLNIDNLEDSYDIEEADIFGTVKYDGKWLGVRFIVKVKK